MLTFEFKPIVRGSGPKPELLCSTLACKGQDTPVDPKSGMAAILKGDGKAHFGGYACGGCYTSYTNEQARKANSNG